MNDFIEQLQNLDESTKTKIMVIATILIMAIIIYFWLGYFGNIVSAVPGQAVASNQQPETNSEKASTPGFFERMGNGLATISHAFENFFQAPKKYLINPK